MPYCPNCGKETTPGATYCHSCGRPLQVTPQSMPYIQPSYPSRKEEIVAVLLSLIIPGAGQMYAGRIVRGIIIFLIPPIFFIFIFLPILFGSLFMPVVTTFPQPPSTIVQTMVLPTFFTFILLILLWLGFIVWNIFDAYNLARIYNQHLMTTGRPPW